ncbi:MAG: hypothetical protein MEQ74_08225 [Paracoccus sp.]|nr:hypothetical protein [Paracoccus sp. (in: a-proteobacteria)]
MTGDSQTPDGRQPDRDRTDESAGEGGLSSDMDYYRIRPSSGLLMMLATIGLPVAVIMLVIVVVIVVF